MVRIADIVGSLSHCFEAQRELELCRRRAQGDVEYFSYSYQQDFKQAQMDLEHALNVYIDQRVAQKLELFNTLAAFEQSLPAARATPLAA